MSQGHLESSENQEDLQKPKPLYLKESAIVLPDGKPPKSREFVPPHTPTSVFDFAATFSKPQQSFRSVDDLEIPCVREVGIKYCIKVLGDYFGLTEYKHDLLQFWILDMITDCLWTTQDDFGFPPEHQKVTLSWMLYFLDILRDSTRNIGREKFFKIFKEAILMASEVVTEGCVEVPTPERLFALIEEDQDSEQSWKSSYSEDGSSLDVSETDSVTYVKVPTSAKYYELPKEPCGCFAYDQSSIETTYNASSSSKSREPLPKLDENDGSPNLEEKTDSIFDARKYYEHEAGIPARFLPVPKESTQGESISESVSLCNGALGTNYVREIDDKYKITTQTVFSKSTSDSNSISIGNLPSTSHLGSKCDQALVEKSVLKTLATHKMWEQRMLDMDDPRKGWVPHEEAVPPGYDEYSDSSATEDNENTWFEEYLDSIKEDISKANDIRMINFGVLWAIVDYVIRNFYDSFQFWLIRLAFQATPNIITQKLNSEWKIPKRNKEQFQRPKYVKEKPKKQKPQKEKKAKTKKDKGKKEKKQKAKKEKSPKKPKPTKLTKEQKAEMERLRREQARIEEEMRKLEENKRFVFPLGDAATDELFRNMFENWVKVDVSKLSGKGGKKGKKKK